jgi:hypothetical protein
MKKSVLNLYGRGIKRVCQGGGGSFSRFVTKNELDQMVEKKKWTQLNTGRDFDGIPMVG